MSFLHSYKTYIYIYLINIVHSFFKSSSFFFLFLFLFFTQMLLHPLKPFSFTCMHIMVKKCMHIYIYTFILLLLYIYVCMYKCVCVCVRVPHIIIYKIPLSIPRFILAAFTPTRLIRNASL